MLVFFCRGVFVSSWFCFIAFVLLHPCGFVLHCPSLGSSIFLNDCGSQLAALLDACVIESAAVMRLYHKELCYRFMRLFLCWGVFDSSWFCFIRFLHLHPCGFVLRCPALGLSILNHWGSELATSLDAPVCGSICSSIVPLPQIVVALVLDT